MTKCRATFNRSAQYAIVPIEVVRAFNVRSDEEVIEAQKAVDDDMLSALEDMVNLARAGKLEGQGALAALAAAW